MNMIIIWVAGGLGNQLFFINKALELKPNSRFVFLDTKFYKNDIRYGRKFHFKEQMKIIPIFNRKLIYILFRINKIGMPKELTNILENPKIKKIGIAIRILETCSRK